MRFYIITLFPDIFDSVFSESILARAIKNKKIKISFLNPRKFVSGKYKKVWPDGNVSLQVDERPYAGGPGMAIMAEPIVKATVSILNKINRRKDPKVLVINFVPRATKFTTKLAKSFSRTYTDIIMIAGHYEGIDERVNKIIKREGDSIFSKKNFKLQKISVGDYVLTGGEIPAMILVDSISRQIEGVLGNFSSREEERISSSAVYTRPEVIEYKGKKYKVPKVLLSGDHKKIDEYKRKH